MLDREGAWQRRRLFILEKRRFRTNRKKPRILFHHLAALPEKCVINGIIVNEEAFLDAIMKFKAGCRFRLEKAELIVDSSHIMVKGIAVPDR